MFFVLSKTIGIMLLPANFLVGIGLVGVLLLMSRWAALGRRLMVASIVLLVICGFSPLGSWVLYPLEQRFPPWDASHGAPDGILVLGGAIAPESSAARGVAVFTDSADRIIATAELARRYPDARVVFSGGSANLISGDAREADYAEGVFEGLGVAKERLTMERGSRNTLENAEFSKALVAPKSGERWLLVTSAFHMPRSVGLFRKVGFKVEPYPVDWRSRGRASLWTFGTNLGGGLARLDLAVREWIGLAAYWINGKTSEFFPGPDPQ